MNEVRKIVKLKSYRELFSIHRQIDEDRSRGIDPGLRWAKQYPEADVIEFVIERPVSAGESHG